MSRMKFYKFTHNLTDKLTHILQIVLLDDLVGILEEHNWIQLVFISN